MANPFLVLGGIAVGVVVAGFGIVQVPGWIDQAHAAAALDTIANMSDAQAAINASEGHYVDTMTALSTGSHAQLKPANGVDVTHINTSDGGSKWCGVVESASGKFFAGSNADRASGPYETTAEAAAGANCDTDATRGMPGKLDGHTRFEVIFDARTSAMCRNIGFTLGSREQSLDATIDWGDGSPVVTAPTGTSTHVYAAPGEYKVVIDGTIPSITFNGNARMCMTSVPAWGDTGTETARLMFAFTPRLSEVEAPPFTITDMQEMFSESSFNGYVGDWDVANVTNMQEMFSSGSTPGVFNQDVSEWDVSNVKNMRMMFEHQVAFNQPLGKWDTSSLENASSMFARASAFNQPIGNWNVSNVTSMEQMFWGATAFNQPLAGWETGNVGNMGHMFANAPAFNQNISLWNTGKVSDFSGMFKGASSFNGDLSAWRVSAAGTGKAFEFADGAGAGLVMPSFSAAQMENPYPPYP